MDDNNTLALIFNIVMGGLISLVTASLSAHFGFRSADRLPGESRKPHCLFCLRPLLLHEYFPLFGWLFRPNPLSLACPCGKKKGLWVIPAVELLAFVMGIIAVILAGWSPLMIPVCMALGLLPAIAVIDLSFGIIPDGLNLFLAVTGIAALLLGQADVFMSLIGSAGLLAMGLLLAIGYSKLRKKEMLGLGDVKFFAAAGLWVPVMIIPWFLIAAGVIGAMMGLAWKQITKTKEFPFAPALCLALSGCLYYQLYVYATP
ncbi:MAG: prepilin peptidase [Proteobacteria bacterium]|jgi:leader peptidase (prepilin peptidase)/N-methyltransferase|nr:A24 family peptidase [Alphaproteobacteria bacterium]NCC03142.1 prepilin peptidase [Pseudomonadota bacterium]